MARRGSRKNFRGRGGGGGWRRMTNCLLSGALPTFQAVRLMGAPTLQRGRQGDARVAPPLLGMVDLDTVNDKT